MNADSVSPAQPPLLLAPAEGLVRYRDIAISGRSRFITWLLKWTLRPMLARMIRGSDEKIARTQLKLTRMRCPKTHGQTLEYTVVGALPGQFLLMVLQR